MQRMRVDLPEPEGPMTTTTSPLFTDSEMSLRTWNSPNHLLSPSISMILVPAGASALTALLLLPALTASVTAYLLHTKPGSRGVDTSALAYPELFLKLATGYRHPVREEEVDEGDEQEDFEFDAARHLQGRRLDRHEIGDLEEVDEADDEHQRRVLEQPDRLTDDGGDHGAQSLWQHDEARGLPAGQPQGPCSFGLPSRDGLQTATHVLRHVGRREQRDGDVGSQYRRQRVGVDVQDQREQQRRDEQPHDQWRAAHYLDEADAEVLDGGELAAASQGEGDTKREAGDDACEQ